MLHLEFAFLSLSSYSAKFEPKNLVDDMPIALPGAAVVKRHHNADPELQPQQDYEVADAQLGERFQDATWLHIRHVLTTLLPIYVRGLPLHPRLKSGSKQESHLPTPLRAGGTGRATHRTRHRQPPRHDAQSPAGNNYEFVDPRTIAHISRRSEILDLLGPLIPRIDDGCTLLVCCGSANQCRVFPVRIHHQASEMERWQRIQDAWYAHKKVWLPKKLVLLGVQRVCFAKVSNV